MAFNAAIADAIMSGVNSTLGFFSNMYAADKTSELGKLQNQMDWDIAQENLGYQREANAQNIAFQRETNAQNLAYQREVNAKNEALMREGWARDDSARQRMVSDLESAGLSKWLATGASPMSSSPVSLGAAHAETPAMQALHNDYKFDSSHYGNAINMRADALSHLYSNFLNFENTKKQNALLDQQKAVADFETIIKQKEAEIKAHDAYVLSGRSNSMSTDPAGLKYIDEIVKLLQGEKNNQLKGIYDNLTSSVTSKKEAAKKQLSEVKENIEKKAYNAMVDVADFVAPIPQSKPGQKPLSMSEWMSQNEYTTGSRETAAAYNRYVRSWYDNQKQRKRR